LKCTRFTELWSPYELDQIDFGPTTETDISLSTPGDLPLNDYRPWYVDNNNTAYVGLNRVWKRAVTGPAWQLAYHVFPLSDTTTNIADIAISDADSNTVYIDYFAGTRNDTTLTGPFNPYGRLFVSTNAYDPIHPIEWTSITPDSAATYLIQCIAIDPANAARIWIGFRGVDNQDMALPPSEAKTRVYYSPDYGATWYDVS
jgi:hypothetical protein